MMKNILIAISLWVVCGCQKDPSLDKRSKYLGNYLFNVHRTVSYGLPPNYHVDDTTYTYSGNVSLYADTASVIILFSKNDSVTPAINEDGTFHPAHSHYSSLEGKFKSSKNVEFKFEIGTLGLAHVYQVTGEKQ